jgi:hypothetical protein
VIAPALRYCLIIFALGFVLGTIRTLWLAPAIGATAAVICELPLMLAASWWTANRIVRRNKIAPGTALAMGALAFALLIAAEALLAISLTGQSLGQWSGDLVRTPGWIGLCGQILFGLFPWIAARRAQSV